MLSQITLILFLLLDFAALTLYDLRAFSYCASLLEMNSIHKRAKLASILVNCLLLAVFFLVRMPLVLAFLAVYLVVLLEFCLLFQGNILTFLFGSGDLLFHLMDVQMVVTALYVLLFGISSREEFLRYYPSSLFLTLLLVTVLLEVSRRFVDRQGLRLLLRNGGQLLFATTSILLIDVYLILLSVAYGGQAYSPVAAIFLLCTGTLLFGAFYTAFQHAVRMSMLLEYQVKSRALENELEQSYEHLAAVQAVASTDALTQVCNRQCGLEALAGLLESGGGGSVCFVDVDHLKQVNDRYGHEEGDRYLLRVVQALSELLPQPHTLARLGGDEFLVLLPGVPETQAAALLEHVRQRLADAASAYRSALSYGAVGLEAGERMPAGELLRRADERMYSYKLAHR